MDCRYKFRLPRLQPAPTPSQYETRSRRPSSSGSRGVWITLAIILFIAGLLLGYSLNLPLASLKLAGTTVTTTVQAAGAQCVEQPEPGSWTSYRIDALAPSSLYPDFLRDFLNSEMNPARRSMRRAESLILMMSSRFTENGYTL